MVQAALVQSWPKCWRSSTGWVTGQGTIPPPQKERQSVTHVPGQLSPQYPGCTVQWAEWVTHVS